MNARFWQNWPANRQKNFFVLVGVAWCVLIVSVFFSVQDLRLERQAETRRLAARLERVRTLTAEYAMLSGGGQTEGAAVEVDPDATILARTQAVTRSLGLQSRLVSIRPIELTGGQDGVRLAYERLDLQQLVGLLQTIPRRRIALLSVLITQNPQNGELANMQLTAARP